MAMDGAEVLTEANFPNHFAKFLKHVQTSQASNLVCFSFTQYAQENKWFDVAEAETKAAAPPDAEGFRSVRTGGGPQGAANTEAIVDAFDGVSDSFRGGAAEDIAAAADRALSLAQAQSPELIKAYELAKLGDTLFELGWALNNAKTDAEAGVSADQYKIVSRDLPPSLLVRVSKAIFGITYGVSTMAGVMGLVAQATQQDPGTFSKVGVCVLALIAGAMAKHVNGEQATPALTGFAADVTTGSYPNRAAYALLSLCDMYLGGLTGGFLLLGSIVENVPTGLSLIRPGIGSFDQWGSSAQNLLSGVSLPATLTMFLFFGRQSRKLLQSFFTDGYLRLNPRSALVIGQLQETIGKLPAEDCARLYMRLGKILNDTECDSDARMRALTKLYQDTKVPSGLYGKAMGGLLGALSASDFLSLTASGKSLVTALYDQFPWLMSAMTFSFGIGGTFLGIPPAVATLLTAVGTAAAYGAYLDKGLALIGELWRERHTGPGWQILMMTVGLVSTTVIVGLGGALLAGLVKEVICALGFGILTANMQFVAQLVAKRAYAAFYKCDVKHIEASIEKLAFAKMDVLLVDAKLKQLQKSISERNVADSRIASLQAYLDGKQDRPKGSYIREFIDNKLSDSAITDSEKRADEIREEIDRLKQEQSRLNEDELTRLRTEKQRVQCAYDKAVGETIELSPSLVEARTQELLQTRLQRKLGGVVWKEGKWQPQPAGLAPAQQVMSDEFASSSPRVPSSSLSGVGGSGFCGAVFRYFFPRPEVVEHIGVGVTYG